jgi:hypothetical protein
METIPILSLIVAALAVFSGPLLSARAARRAMLGPMRQKWINDLRDLLSEITSCCLHYYVEGYEDFSDKEYQHITHLQHRIMFMINQDEKKHTDLIKSLEKMVFALDRGADFEFRQAYEKLIIDGRDVLTTEWNVVKKP